MWELRNKLTLGRYRQRRFHLVATAFVMAIFMVVTTLSQPALAADATRNGTTVTYNSTSYEQLQSSDRLPAGLPSGTSGYQYVDSAAKKTYFILTTGDPAKATQAQYVYYDGLPSSNFSNPSPPQTISIANVAPDSLAETGSDRAVSPTEWAGYCVRLLTLWPAPWTTYTKSSRAFSLFVLSKPILQAHSTVCGRLFEISPISVL